MYLDFYPKLGQKVLAEIAKAERYQTDIDREDMKWGWREIDEKRKAKKFEQWGRDKERDAIESMIRDSSEL